MPVTEKSLKKNQKSYDSDFENDYLGKKYAAFLESTLLKYIKKIIWKNQLFFLGKQMFEDISTTSVSIEENA